MLSTICAVCVFMQTAQPPAPQQPAPPSITITGPTEVLAGDRIVIVTAKINNPPNNIINQESSWSVLVDGMPMPNNLVIPGTDETKATLTVFGSSRTKSKTVVCYNVTYLTGEKTKAVIDGKETDVYIDPKIVKVPVGIQSIAVVDDATPIPDPNVPPTPEPDTPVVLPDGKFKVAQHTYDLIKGMSISNADKYKLATKLAEAYEGVSGKIAALGTNYGTVETAIADVQAANRNAIATSGIQASDLENIKNEIAKKVYEIWSQNMLKTVADWDSYCKEMATGLRGVKP